MTGIDGVYYPDMDAPSSFDEPEDRADYLHRVCTAWDFRIQPEKETFALLATWKDVFDRFPVATSPAYHTMRWLFGWERIPFPEGLRGPEPHYVHLDRLEGRGEDPCLQMI